MTEMELPVTGYLDRLSFRPGERMTAFLSAREAGAVRVRLLRVVSGDPNPAGPGMRLDDLSDRLDQTIQAQRQPITRGSHAVVEWAPPRDAGQACTWTALACSGVVDRSQTVMAEQDGESSVALSVEATGVSARFAWP